MRYILDRCLCFILIVKRKRKKKKAVESNKEKYEVRLLATRNEKQIDSRTRVGSWLCGLELWHRESGLNEY